MLDIRLADARLLLACSLSFLFGICFKHYVEASRWSGPRALQAEDKAGTSPLPAPIADDAEAREKCAPAPKPSPGYTKRLARKAEKMKLCGQLPAPDLRLDYLDRFLRWECGAALQDMALFPNAKEITESVACLQALDKHVEVPFGEPATICIVVGDGSTPRTAALLAMRTRWRLLSVDPALVGLPLPGCEPSGAAENGSEPVAVAKKRRQNLEAKLAHQQEQEAPRRAKLRERLAKISGVSRLELHARPMEEVQLDVGPDVRHVVVVLPHAHVVPAATLRSLILEPSTPLPSISVVQLPCCGMKRHTQICGLEPDVEYEDKCICTPERGIRVWKDVSSAARETKTLCYRVEEALVPVACEDPAQVEWSVNLVAAAAADDLSSVRRLLQRPVGTIDAQVDLSPSWPSVTALYAAAAHGSTQVVPVLIEAGADVHLRVRRRKGTETALAVAETLGHTVCAEAIRAAGAAAAAADPKILAKKAREDRSLKEAAYATAASRPNGSG